MLAKLTFRPLFILLHFLLFAISVLGVKLIIGKALSIRDDDHIYDILRSKFTDFANFHTRLYTCAAEFDFIAMEVQICQCLATDSSLDHLETNLHTIITDEWGCGFVDIGLFIQIRIEHMLDISLA